MIDVAIVGGGAAGYFAAINIAEKNPNKKVVIFEKGKSVLTKVKISGGGRCNVTNAEFIPNELVKHYPRGENELKGPFHTFCTGDTMAFFEARGVPLKIEEDGRIFPESNTSQTIIDCFLKEVDRLGIKVYTNTAIKNISKEENWVLRASETYEAKILLIASGSSPNMWKMLQQLGHKIIDPVPSLFTFNIEDERLKNLPGISTLGSVEVLFPDKKVKFKLQADGPILITHWGLSGPAVLKLSAWGAILLNHYKYQFQIRVNWLPIHTTEEVEKHLMDCKAQSPKKQMVKSPKFNLPKRLWEQLVIAAGLEQTKWAELSKKQVSELRKQLCQCQFRVNGKSTFKDEFVTAGGVDLKEINFKTYESKLIPSLYFAGEVLNIDGITGGFNFQNAWTGAYIAAQAIASN